MASYEQLAEENIRLRTEIAELKRRLRVEAQQQEDISRLQQVITQQEKTITDLVKENITLKEDMLMLKSQLFDVMDEFKQLKVHTNHWEAREAVRALEWFVALEVMGSRTAIKKSGPCTLKLMQKQKPNSLPHWITPAIVQRVGVIKDRGDSAVHDKPFTKVSLLAALSDKDDDLDMVAEKMVLVEQLERYYSKHNLDFGYPIER